MRAREQLIVAYNNPNLDRCDRDGEILVAAITRKAKVELYALVDCKQTANSKYLRQEITDAIVALKSVERKLRDSGETRPIESSIYCTRLPPAFKTPEDILGSLGELNLGSLETIVSERQYIAHWRSATAKQQKIKAPTSL